MSYSMFDLSGKVVLVTGGNRGIGLGMADALAQAGADVVIWGTNAQRNEEAAVSLRQHGTRIMTAQVDISQEAVVIEQMAAAVAQMGRIDAVFANAGMGTTPVPFVKQSVQDWRAVFAVNLEGTFFTLREAARHMKARAEAGDPGGSLVGIGSLAGVDAAGFMEAYGATKAGVMSMIKGVATELARYGVRANSVLPGWIATDMTATSRESKAIQENVLPRIPLRRWGEPGDLGGIAIYLASDASRYHTGDLITVDGGYAVY